MKELISPSIITKLTGLELQGYLVAIHLCDSAGNFRLKDVCWEPSRLGMVEAIRKGLIRLYHYPAPDSPQWLETSLEIDWSLKTWYGHITSIPNGKKANGSYTPRCPKHEPGKNQFLFIEETGEARDDVADVWDTYIAAWSKKHPTSKRKPVLDPKRRAMIAARLGTFQVSEIKMAIEGLFISPFHNGQNEQGTSYLTPEHALRDDLQVEKCIRILQRECPTTNQPALRQFNGYKPVPPELRATPEKQRVGMEMLDNILKNYGNGGK